MLSNALLLWLAGLFTVVPYAVYYLLFQAQRHQYALLIGLTLFWIFGFWGIAGPVILLVKMYRLRRSFEKIGAQEQLEELLHSDNASEVAIELIASENKIPRFIAKLIYSKAMERMVDISSSKKPDRPKA